VGHDVHQYKNESNHCVSLFGNNRDEDENQPDLLDVGHLFRAKYKLKH